MLIFRNLNARRVFSEWHETLYWHPPQLLTLLYFSKQANYNDFEDFINTYDIDEALGSMLNKNGVDIDINRVQFVDVSQMTGQARKDGPKPVYRDYPTD